MAQQIGDVVLQVEDLHTYFFTRSGVVKAVDGVSFHLRQGETLGIVGESGCGKTMTALSLLRLIPQPGARIVQGKVLLQGENLLDKSEKEMRQLRGRRISMILQDPQTSLNPVFTIGNQLIEAIKIHQQGRTAKAGATCHQCPEAGARGGPGATRGRLSAPDERGHETACRGGHCDVL